MRPGAQLKNATASRGATIVHWDDLDVAPDRDLTQSSTGFVPIDRLVGLGSGASSGHRQPGHRDLIGACYRRLVPVLSGRPASDRHPHRLQRRRWPSPSSRTPHRQHSSPSESTPTRTPTSPRPATPSGSRSAPSTSPPPPPATPHCSAGGAASRPDRRVRCGRHQQLRRRTVPPPAHPRSRGHRGQPTRPGSPPPPRQDPTPSTLKPPPAPCRPATRPEHPKRATGGVEMIRTLRIGPVRAVKGLHPGQQPMQALLDHRSHQLREQLRGLPVTNSSHSPSPRTPGPLRTHHDAAMLAHCPPSPAATRPSTTRSATLDKHLTALDRRHRPAAARDRSASARHRRRATAVAAGDNPDRLRSEAAFAHALRRRTRSPPPPARPAATASTAAATAKPTPRSTASSSSACASDQRHPRLRRPDAPPKARPRKRSSAASSATSPANSSPSS